MPGTDAAPHLIAIYADESCLGNGREGDNPGGAGGLIELPRDGDREPIRRDYWLAEPSTTNNRMALRSAIEGLRLVGLDGASHHIVFTSDSRYLVDGMTSWVYDWARRGWRRKTGAIENVALWRELVETARRHRVAWRWVRGHAGHPQNEYANVLATRAAARQVGSNGMIDSEFDTWLAAERARGRVTIAPDPMPDRSMFEPARELPAVQTESLF
ncbi:MAG TPA: ribonuclease H [Gemmatimonadaceae bacterium]|nr:ribonuclease H [Gemmatimonadaceae bacterium]